MINKYEVTIMRTLTALLSAMVLGLTAAPMAAFAETSTETSSAEIQIGDVNADGIIDATDATLTLRYYTLMISEVEPADIPYYDTIVKYGNMNGDGVIDATDASIILRQYTEYASTTTDGDVNRDGVVDEIDAFLIFNCYGELIAETDFAEIPYYDNIVKYGDMNRDGFIDGIDTFKVLQIYEARTGEKFDFSGSIDVKKYLKEKGVI